MKTDRMTERVPSAIPLGYARWMDKKIAFNKISSDRSGKTNIIDSENSVVLGVLFGVDEKDIAKLDEFEKGYERKEVTVLSADDQLIHAFTYISSQTNDVLKPYDWYLDLLIQGAEENGLPDEYVENLRKVVSMPDPRKKISHQ